MPDTPISHPIAFTIEDRGNSPVARPGRRWQLRMHVGGQSYSAMEEVNGVTLEDAALTIADRLEEKLYKERSF